MMQCIDDLQFLEALGPLQHREDRPLDDQVVQVQFQQRLGGNAIEKFRRCIGGGRRTFWDLVVEAFFVLEKNQRPRTDVFGQQKCAAIGAMGWNRAVFGRVFEKPVGRDAVVIGK